MKKTIKVLVEKMDKLKEKNNGKLEGGFTSIKGGFNNILISTNIGNGTGCTNSGDCTQTTNSGTPTCTNTKTCFM
ncbi:hypothetical protein [Rhizosphaericola mali]|uniref:Uncharacterized protein n=1 Tax=Rhizosphaericola mali TaxID=2545455 RepID=A0A5P2G5I3_9BACT|nr:hypothetical protein [Rhizosphaericola mali]QES91066.1 hypothetical protein E0W69_020345 [Rhizosphaericola mali]